MRKTLVSSVFLVLIAAGAITVAASGGDQARAVDISAANGKTAAATSVHYSVGITLTKRRLPLSLHIMGAASRDSVAVHLRLGALTLKDGTTLPGTSGAVLLKKPFLYESSPNGIAVFGNIRWLRLQIADLSPRSEVLSMLRSLTPSPLLRVVSEAKLRPTQLDGGFAGTVRYDDPVVRTALTTLGGGLEFRRLRVFVHVGDDGRIDKMRLTGRTADGHTKLSLHARLYAFGVAVKVVPPKPGTFMDRELARLQA